MCIRDRAIFAQLPEDLKSVIKPVIKKTYEPGGIIATITTTDKLWPMSGVESAYLSSSEEGYPYPIFTNATSRIKRLSNGDGSVEDYWLRTPNTSYTNRWIDVYKRQRQNLESLLEELKPTKEQLKKLQNEAFQAGQAVPEYVNQGLTSIYKLEAIKMCIRDR